MKSDTITRLKRLEDAVKRGNGVIIVDRVDNGYKLPDGEVVADLDALRGRYGVILVDDVKYHLDHLEEWTDFERCRRPPIESAELHKQRKRKRVKNYELRKILH